MPVVLFVRPSLVPVLVVVPVLALVLLLRVLVAFAVFLVAAAPRRFPRQLPGPTLVLLLLLLLVLGAAAVSTAALATRSAAVVAEPLPEMTAEAFEDLRAPTATPPRL